MNALKSITVTVNDGAQDTTFEVDLDTNGSLPWNKDGWQVLEDYYVKAKPDPETVSVPAPAPPISQVLGEFDASARWSQGLAAGPFRPGCFLRAQSLVEQGHQVDPAEGPSFG